MHASRRLFRRNRKLSDSGAVAARRPSGFAAEALESRTLLTATVVSPLPAQTVAEDTPTTIDLSSTITDPAHPSTIVQFTTSAGIFDAELNPAAAPQTVANFLKYVSAGFYNNTIIDASINDPTGTPPVQFIQGGGFSTTGTPVSSFGTIPNEFNQSNLAGTLAMSKAAGQTNGASNQWFVNVGNNTSFDTANGGYTVFGKIIVGLQTVDNINGLPTTDGTLLNPAIGTNLPVTSQPPAGTPPTISNLVVVQSVAVIPAITFTAVSDNLQLVNPTISGSQLTFNPAPGLSGFCHVIVSGTDLFGHAVTQRLLVEVTPTAARTAGVMIGAGQSARTVTWRDQTGAASTLTLNGPGTALVTFAGDSPRVTHPGGAHVAGSNLEVMSISATGTTAATSLVGHGARGRIITLGSITTDGSFGKIRIKNAVVEGNLTAPQGLGNVQIDYFGSGTITSGARISPGRPLDIKGIAYSDVSVSSTGAIGAIQSTVGWNNGDNVSESITAPSIRSIRARGNFTPGLLLSGSGAAGGRTVGNLSIRGYIGGVWSFPAGPSSLSVGGTAPDFAGTFATPLNSFTVKANFGGTLSAPTIKTLRVGGMISQATINLTTPLAAGTTGVGRLIVRGAIDHASINCAGNIGKVTAEALTSSTLYAGVGTIASGLLLPAVPSDFTSAAKITSVVLTPKKKVSSFANSVIAANQLGDLSLGAVYVNNSGVAFGVAASSIGKLTGHDNIHNQSFSLTGLTTAAQVAAAIAAQKLTPADFKIVIV